MTKTEAIGIILAPLVAASYLYLATAVGVGLGIYKIFGGKRNGVSHL